MIWGFTERQSSYWKPVNAAPATPAIIPNPSPSNPAEAYTDWLTN